MQNNELTLPEKFYIESNHNKMSVEEIAKNINKNEKVVNDYVLVIQQQKYDEENDSKTQIPVKQEPSKPDSPLLKSFGRRKNGVVVMTGSASLISDEVEKNRGALPMPQSNQNCILPVRK